MSDISLFHTTHSKLTPKKISGELLPSGHIYVNWNQLGKHGNVRRYVIHYKSLNSNRVGDLFCGFCSARTSVCSRAMQFASHGKRNILLWEKFNRDICMKFMSVESIDRIEFLKPVLVLKYKQKHWIKHQYFVWRRFRQNDQTCNRLIFRKLTPDWVWLEWEKSKDVQQTDIRCFQLNTNGETTAVLPATENRFVFNDGEIGQRYIFQLEVKIFEDLISSIYFYVHQ